MPRLPTSVRQVFQLTKMVLMLVANAMHVGKLCLRSRSALAAENLFLRQQLALDQTRNVKPQRVTPALRFTLVWLSYWFDWRPALTIVQPETFKRWRRQGLLLLWKTPSTPGRPPIPPALQALIHRMARENLTWGQKRIANELRLKLGLQVSPRTVRKYMANTVDRGPGQRGQSQRWRTFMRNHAQGLIQHGLSTVLSRGWHIVSTRVIERLKRWQDRCAAGHWRRATLSEAPTIFLRRPTRLLCLEASLYRADVPWIVDRSPPAMGPSRIRSLMSAGTPVSRSDLRPVELALYKWKPVRPNSCGAEPQCKGRNQVVVLRRAA